MKRRMRNIVLKIILAALLFGILPTNVLTASAEDGYVDETITDEPFAPENPEDPTDTEIPLRKITLSKTSLTLLKGKTKKLTVSYTPSDTTDSKKVTYTSSNKKVATVSSAGKITAKKAGKATITAKCGTKKATCKVTVKEIHLKSIKLNKTSKVVDKGTTFRLKVTYSPSNTTDSKKVTYASSNKKVATVNSSGKITAKSYGTATITAKCGTKKATCEITVKNGYESVTKAYTELNNFRTGGKVWYWNPDDKTKTWFNTKASNTLTALKRDKVLETTARTRAKDLVKVFAHYRPNGDICFDIYPDDLWGCGENIAYGYPTAVSVTDAWKETNDKYAGQGHRRNMLNDTFNVVGIACYQYNGVKYWVQCFGYRP